MRAIKNGLTIRVERTRNRICDKYEHDLSDTTIDIQPQSPKGEPCLSVIDYVTWALQRAYTKREMRYYDFVEDKVRYVADIYDFQTYPKNRYYHEKRMKKAGGGSWLRKANLFDIEKATPL